MKYKLSANRLTNFLRYVNKAFKFQKLVQEIADARQHPRIKTESLFMSLFFCLLLRWGSFNRSRKELQANALEKFLPLGLGQKANSDNTLRYSLAQFDLESLNRQLILTAKRLKRMKALEPMEGFQGFQGLNVVSLDATEHFRSSKIHCEECLVFSTPTKEDPTKVSYAHRGVFAQMISAATHPFLAFEPILPKDTQSKEELERFSSTTSFTTPLPLRLLS